MRLRLFVLLALFVPAPRFVAAQTSDTARRPTGATVSGVVHDSIARAPLAGAIVQIVATDDVARFGRTAVSDSLGRFTLGHVPSGRYTVGFFHPLLDSLGVEPPLREVRVDSLGPVNTNLAIPSPVQLRAAICGMSSVADSSAVLVGVVRDARTGAPVSGVMVTGEWLELSFRRSGLERHVPRLTTTTADNGWFAMCRVPKPGTMHLTASRGADSTDVIEVLVPPDGFLRRDLYLGSSRVIASHDSAPPGWASLLPPRLRVGDGRLTGTVITAADGRPLPGAQVSIAGGPQTRANERGEWALTDAPTGTRMLDVRAVGYYPEHRRVDVVVDAQPVFLTLSTVKAVLDTVRITAERLKNRNDSGFEERRRKGAGYFITDKDITQRQPVVLSEVFRMVPGVRLDDASVLDRRFRMRGPFGECMPNIHLDGLPLGDHLTADELDTWARPADIKGIEVYSEATVPVQFHIGKSDPLNLTTCGTIVIWTK
ncbi:MAG: carboxypeptidase regulatory-like domain-containing protein [bacterium]